MTDETPDDRMKRLLTGQVQSRLPRKFYKSVEISENNAILLDGKPVKTPLKNALQLPNRALAEAVAAEWVAQEKVINPDTMPLTRLANTALDRATNERGHVLQEVTEYAGSDLVCYWADRPPDLVALQRQHWQPVLDWANQTLPATFKAVSGITHAPQDPESLRALSMRIAVCDAWQLTGIYLTMTLTGSALLALMMQAEATDGATLWAAAHVDEDYQISNWGEDWEAADRRKARKRAFDGLVQYFALLRP